MRINKTSAIKIIPYVVILVLGILFLLNFNSKKGTTTITKSDTITIHSTDSFTVTKPKIVRITKVSTIRDTLNTVDSIPIQAIVNIPITQKKYKDSIICGKDTAIILSYVSGYKQKLDSLHLDLFRNTQVITNTTIIKKNNKRYSVGIQLGTTLSNWAIKPYIGIGISYNLFSF
jgi:hypothetical protein